MTVTQPPLKSALEAVDEALSDPASAISPKVSTASVSLPPDLRVIQANVTLRDVSKQEIERLEDLLTQQRACLTMAEAALKAVGYEDPPEEVEEEKPAKEEEPPEK